MKTGLLSHPHVSSAIRKLRNTLVSVGLMRRKYEDEFTHIFETRYWGAKESVSGGGSDEDATRVIRSVLPRIFEEKSIKSFFDIPCGDFNWMQSVDLGGIDYIGGDIVAPLVERNRKRHARAAVHFLHLDVIHDRLPAADLVLCRDCLVHLPLADATKALRNIVRNGSKWLLTTTFPLCTDNTEIAAGKWRPLNLHIAPFHLPEPDELINEECVDADGAYADKSLGLWSCEAVRGALG